MVEEVIITGCPRTGTSALGALLYHSEGVMITNELSTYHSNKNAISVSLDLVNPHLDRALELKGWSIDNLTDYLSGDFEDHSIKLFGDKNPAYCCDTFLPQHLSTTYPDFKYLFCYRDPCATVSSFLRRSTRENDVTAAWYSRCPDDALDIIIKYTLNWATLLYPKVKNKKIIVYEDYCEDLNRLMQELNKFFGITLTIHEPERIYLPVNVDTWKSDLSAEAIEMIKTKFEPVDQYVRSLIQNES